MGKKIRMLFVWKAFFGGLKPFLLNGGALGYRPDLFGDESPNPFLASRLFERTFLFRFPLIAKQSKMEGQGNSGPLWGMGNAPSFPVPCSPFHAPYCANWLW